VTRTYGLPELLNDYPKLHRDRKGNQISWQLSAEVLHFIDGYVNASHNTLETGAGVSTVEFAMKGASHICVVPDAQEVEAIKEYCRRHQISSAKIQFYVDRSETVLPLLETPPLDLVLIDGRHAFPTPFIDWYYGTVRLKTGGILIIDDTHLLPCQILKEFLLLEPEWRLEQDFPARAAIFSKVKEGSHAKEWNKQPYVVQGNYGVGYRRMLKAFDLLRKGRIWTLREKVIRTLRR
jgi:hypothetical protein